VRQETETDLTWLVGKEVRVSWDDACFDADEKDPSLMHDDYVMRTRGVVARVTESSLFVASEDYPAGGTFRAITRIPWAGVVDIEFATYSGDKPDGFQVWEDGSWVDCRQTPGVPPEEPGTVRMYPWTTDP
jgi:hypothetical protein